MRCQKLFFYYKNLVFCNIYILVYIIYNINYKGGKTMSTLEKIILLQEVDQTYPAVRYQPVSVCVSVTVTPFADTLPTTTFCCDDPIITPGVATCNVTVNGSCTFTIT